MSNHMINAPTDDPLNPPLMQALHFDALDLELNRTHALLSTQQRRRVAFEMYGYLALTIIALIAVCGSLFVWLPALGIVLVVSFVTIAVSGYRLRRNQHIVLSARGPIERSIERSGRSVLYHIRVEDVRFQVPIDVFAAFQDGQNYRLYFISGRLLSAEHDLFRKPMPQ